MVAENREKSHGQNPGKPSFLERSPTQTSFVQEIGACGNTIYYLYI